MKRFHLLVYVLVCTFCEPAFGQSSGDEQAIEKLLEKLFKGMELGDSAMVHSTFSDRATMATVSRGKDNQTVLRQNANALKAFLDAVGTPHAETWHEEIWDTKIQTDGNFAQVWCAYAFYRGKAFSHCGADSFHVYKTSDGWKFFHLAYSIRTTDCNIPEKIQSKHK
jgi:hypothetical protein